MHARTSFVSLLAIIAIGIFLFPSTVLLAQVGTSSEKTAAVMPPPTESPPQRESLRARLSGATEQVRTRSIERRNIFAAAVKNRVKNLLDNVYNRMGATVLRYEQITARIESRMTKLEAIGVSTAESRVALTDAKNEIASAKELLSRKTDSDVDAVVDDISPGERLLVLKTHTAAILGHLTRAHTSLSSTVTLLKTAPLKPSEQQQDAASSTSAE